MDVSAKRGVRHVTAEWQLPQVLDSLAKALNGSGPALRFAERNNPSLIAVPENVAVIVATSGTTGNAKEIGLSASALFASARASNDYLGAQNGDTWSLILPLTHIAGVNVLVRSLELGREPIDLRNITDESLPTADFTAIVPTQLHRAVHTTGQLLRHLQSAHRVLIGGASLGPSLRDEANSVQVRVTSTYGMTETSGGCVYDGVPLAGVEVEIRDGRIAFKGEHLASYYLPTNESEKIRPIPNEEGWFISNDIGHIEDGKLVVEGRADDVIISGGEKVSLNTIERFLSDLIEGEVVAFAQPDPEWGQRLAIATTSVLTVDQWQGLQSKIREELGRYAIPQDIYRIAEIPRSALGKVDRVALMKSIQSDHR